MRVEGKLTDTRTQTVVMRSTRFTHAARMIGLPGAAVAAQWARSGSRLSVVRRTEVELLDHKIARVRQ